MVLRLKQPLNYVRGKLCPCTSYTRQEQAASGRMNPSENIRHEDDGVGEPDPRRADQLTWTKLDEATRA